MIAIDFPQANVIVGKDQPEYLPLPMHYNPEDPMKPMTCCFELSDEELAEVIRTKRIWYTQCTFGNNLHPVRMDVRSPFPEAVITGE